MNLLVLLVLGGFGGLLVYASMALPPRGNLGAPANAHVSAQLIELALPETNIPNVVTAILADFRSFDTLGETIVVFTAGLAVVLLLGRSQFR